QTAFITKWGFERCQTVQGRISTWVLVLGNGQAGVLWSFILYRQNFSAKKTLLLCYCSILLAVIGNQIRVRPADLIVFSAVSGRPGHAVDANLRFKFWVDKTPTNSRVINFWSTANR